MKLTDGSPMQRISRAIEVLETADVVDDRKRADVVEQRVDREVAAERVLFGRAVGVVAVNQRERSARSRRARLPSADASSGIVCRRQPATSISAVSSCGSTCRLKVATSIVFVPNLTCASRNRRPMIQQLRKSFLT